MSKQYWFDSLKEIFFDYNIQPTEQMLEDIYTIREMESEACGYINIENPLKSENENLKKKLQEEQKKVDCDECGGSGRTNEYYGTIHCNSPCLKCNNTGKIFYWERKK